jgi:CRP-like cAMP-binding protein
MPIRPPRAALTNRLLTALPPQAYKRLVPSLELVSLEAKQVLSQPHAPHTHVYFPETAVISLVYPMPEGPTIEVGMVGNEGVVGLDAFWGASTLPYFYLTLTGGSAHRLPLTVLSAEVQRGGALQAVLLGYTQDRVLQLAQTGLCHSLHSTSQRLCRWLLMVHDRARTEELRLTQADIARVLHVRRTGITAAMGILQQKKVLSYRYGRITIRNRTRLERAACECYRVITNGVTHVWP